MYAEVLESVMREFDHSQDPTRSPHAAYADLGHAQAIMDRASTPEERAIARQIWQRARDNADLMELHCE